MMNRLLLLLVLLISGTLLRAQANYEPTLNNANNNIVDVRFNVFMDPIYGYGSSENTTNFSSQNYWSARAKDRPYDEIAWFNYYRSTRYLADGGNDFASYKASLDEINLHLTTYSAGTWEQLTVEYWNSNRDPSKEASLIEANKLRPTDPLTLRFMTGVEYLHNRNTSSRDYYTKWKATGDTPITTENYAYNVLQSLPGDAILFTNGEMDTYPLIYQIVQNKSTVKVISLAWCEREDNRKTLFTNAGLTLPAGGNPSNNDFISKVAAANPGKKIYVASTCESGMLQSMNANLFCTGLAFRYSLEAIENVVFLRNNVGTRMKLDKVGVAPGGYNHFDYNYSAKLEMNYYLPLLMAADSYTQEGNAIKAAELRAKAKLVRERAGYKEPLRNEG